MSEKPKGVRVTAGDLEAGETGTAGIMDDYVLICAGACRAGRTQAYANGTRILTVMGVQRKAPG